MKPAAVSSGLSHLLLRLWRALSRRRRRQFLLLLASMPISAIAEVVSLGAVLPFLGILVAPDRVFRYRLVASFAHSQGITSSEQLVLPLTIAFAGAALIAGATRLALLWVSTRLAFATGADLGISVYRRSLYQPYSVHVTINSSELISGITSKVGDTVTVLNQTLMLISSSIVVAAIALAMFAINPLVATLATLGFGSGYGIIAWTSRRQLRRNSQQIAREQTQVVKAVQEGLGGIRDVLLDGTQPLYCDIYRRADQPLRRAQGINTFISTSPRFAMESFGMVVIAALAYGLSRRGGGVATALPVLGTLALGAQRLLPALQQCYAAWASIASCHASLARTIALLDQPLPEEALAIAPAPLQFRDEIAFRHVRFRYSADGPWVVNDLNLTIHKGARVGFVGNTGGGKSTTLDLLMGLLTPTEGDLMVDNEPVAGNRIRAWQKTIAHVPQSIYLADTSLAENIAFGMPRDAIDLQRVKQAAQQAQIADFIESLPEEYDTAVGERGVRLSGGQRQRVGIARALYKQASVLVFDEATSALDTATETSVMDAIEGLQRDLTIILIAHRLTTVRRCDAIVELQQGRVVAQGTFDELLQRSASFRKMARAVA